MASLCARPCRAGAVGVQGLPATWGDRRGRAHCPAEQELTNCRQVEAQGPSSVGTGQHQLPVRPTRSADLRTAGDVGTVSLQVPGYGAGGHGPGVTQLPRRPPESKPHLGN